MEMRERRRDGGRRALEQGPRCQTPELLAIRGEAENRLTKVQTKSFHIQTQQRLVTRRSRARERMAARASGSDRRGGRPTTTSSGSFDLRVLRTRTSGAPEPVATTTVEWLAWTVTPGGGGSALLVVCGVPYGGGPGF